MRAGDKLLPAPLKQKCTIHRSDSCPSWFRQHHYPHTCGVRVPLSPPRYETEAPFPEGFHTPAETAQVVRWHAE